MKRSTLITVLVLILLVGAWRNFFSGSQQKEEQAQPLTELKDTYMEVATLEEKGAKRHSNDVQMHWRKIAETNDPSIVFYGSGPRRYISPLPSLPPEIPEGQDLPEGAAPFERSALPALFTKDGPDPFVSVDEMNGTNLTLHTFKREQWKIRKDYDAAEMARDEWVRREIEKAGLPRP